ncbi:hypothetical protein NSI01_30010 [Pimelobacter simplex]|nr:hypothetical protein NSI01_30010 [Pimelobacter simplex]
MSNNSGWGSSLWKDVRKVRVTRGKIEAPVRANGKDGIRIGSSSIVGDDPKAPAAGVSGRQGRKLGLPARLRRWLRKRR